MRAPRGRSAAAPKLKKDKNEPEGALHVSASPQLGAFYATDDHGQCTLSHLLLRDRPERDFPKAAPVKAQYDEPDAAPAQELSDPVPRLTRQPAANPMTLDRSPMKWGGPRADRASRPPQVRGEAVRSHRASDGQAETQTSRARRAPDTAGRQRRTGATSTHLP